MIAFNATVEGAEQIRLVSVATGDVREIASDHVRGDHPYDFRLSLSPDGGTVAFVHMDGEGPNPNCRKDGLFVHTSLVEGGESARLTPECSPG